MADITLGGSLNVVSILTRRDSAIMALSTGSRCHTIMVEYGRGPAVGGMTIVTGIAAGNMIRRFAQRNAAVVAGETAAEYGGMIHLGHRRPAGWTVTVLTQIVGLDVRAVFARRRGAVMTTGTVTADGTVIERRRGPTVGGMTIVTGIAAGNMIRRFAQRNAAVVAGETAAEYGRMVHFGHRRPAGRTVTVFTQIVGLDVRAVFACRRGAVMTTGAITADGAVIERRRGPAVARMTIVTGIAAGNMIR
ncbi:hypothetical protein MNBD_GAMMA13-1817 [hydrothermal vent metagenome]|uniref:Uncharacterized protein n=1 Tax=hydrothermal vent metagenome TaxID=652676 RepID=A0A3B0YTC8_9ZZZZ